MNCFKLVVSQLLCFQIAGPRFKKRVMSLTNCATCLLKLKRFEFTSVSQGTRRACLVFVSFSFKELTLCIYTELVLCKLHDVRRYRDFLVVSYAALASYLILLCDKECEANSSLY